MPHRPALPAPVTVSSNTPAKDLDDKEAKSRATTDDLILNEGVQILADYVHALNPPVEKTSRTRRTEAASLSGF